MTTGRARSPTARVAQAALSLALCVSLPVGSAEKERVGVSIDGRDYTLEILTEQPAGDVPDSGWPVMLITHGSASGSYENVGTRMLERWVRFFSARGYYAVAVARRGYASSDGPPFASLDDCAEPDIRRYLDAQADDLAAVKELIGRRPEANDGRVLAIGHSVGGAAVLALNGRLAGLDAIISVAGGVYHQDPADGLAREFDRYADCERYRAALVDAYAHYGSLKATPTLWIYAANDSSFDTRLVGDLSEAWQSTDRFLAPKVIILPPVDDSHYLFSRDEGPQVMGGAIDDFLAGNELPASTLSFEADIERCLPVDQHAFVQGFLETRNHRALAVSEDGTEAFYEYDFRSLQAAEAEALADCTTLTGAGCRLLVSGEKPVLDGNDCFESGD